MSGAPAAPVLPVIARGLADRGDAVDLVVFSRSGELDGRVLGDVRPVELGDRKPVALPRRISAGAERTGKGRGR